MNKPLSLKKIYIDIITMALISVLLSRIFMYFIWLNIGSKNTFFNDINPWDAGWYHSIVKNGYALYPTEHPEGNAANWAFFPLMPMLIRGICYIFPFSPYIIGSVANTVIFTCALIMAGIYVFQTTQNEVYAKYFIILYSFGIYSIYFSALYTESLFFLEIVCFFYFMRKKNYILMGFFGALCSSSRNVGVFLVFSIATFYTENYIIKNKSFHIIDWLITALKQPRLVFGVALIPSGIFIYMLYLYRLMGDPLAFMHIQRAWGRNMQNPFRILISAITNINSNQFYLAVFALVWFYSTFKLLKKKLYPECCLSIILLLIPLSTGIDSIPRYMIGSFVPLLGFTSDFEYWSLSKKIVVLGGSFLWEFFLIISWINKATFMI
ncbi:MAG: hypothetical protein SPI21_07375 [Hungatella hathewayi]|uniref:hypothetical protein n=1 Tax=Hungatella TaxID=1649459 RepID=UPI001106E5A9|nr:MULTISPECIES: hypothetical protein [Hungatella]MCI7382760.1 hypothetical protein [Hungatella sp.]MDY6236592.1 hypothetical protein [Hungatella hathewayi]